MQAKKGKIKDLMLDDRNANNHSEFGMMLLERGIQKNGLGRSIVVSNDNKIIAGNGVAEQAGAVGLENTIVVETTGKELVVVKRTDITSGSKEFYELALSDNIIAQKNIVLDAEVVDAITTEFKIDGFELGYTINEGQPKNKVASDVSNREPVVKVKFTSIDQLNKALEDLKTLIAKYPGCSFSLLNASSYNIGL